ncbi:protein RIC-3 [Polymixia lowei]
MSITTCQKVTLISCSVLCISLFLPKMLLSRGKKDIVQPEVGPGFYPPMMHRLSLPEDPAEWGEVHPNSRAHSAEAMAKVKGMGRTNKYNLMGQVIPIYGFGILLYILYIIYKLTCKGKTAKSESHYLTLTNENVGKKTTTDYELARLQEKLLQTEKMIERIASGKHHGSGRSKKKSKRASKREEKLLRQLKQISQLMQEGRLEGASPEMEAEEVPYTSDWEGYPEETYPQYDEPYRSSDYDPIVLTEPTSRTPTAEALAERMLQVEEEEVKRKLEVVQEEDEEEEEEDDEEEPEEEEEEEEEEDDEEEAEKMHLLSPSAMPNARERVEERLGWEVSKELLVQSAIKKQISFSDHEDVFHYPKEGTYEEEDEDEGEEEEADGEEDQTYDVEEIDEEDPVMEAESLTFGCGSSFSVEEEAEQENEECLLTSLPVKDDRLTHSDMVKDLGMSGLRMRNRRET